MTFRVFLAFLGTLFLLAAGLGISREEGGLGWLAWSVIAHFALGGASLLGAAFFASNQNAEKWSDAAGNHELGAVVLVLAFPVTWAIRKVFPSDDT